MEAENLNEGDDITAEMSPYPEECQIHEFDETYEEIFDQYFAQQCEGS